MAKEKTITLNNTPAFYLEYTRNWLAHQRKANVSDAELAMVEDISKLVEIAVGVLTPAESETDKTD